MIKSSSYSEPGKDLDLVDSYRPHFENKLKSSTSLLILL